MITNLEEIKELRKKMGITQKELAQYSHVSQSMIAKIEAKKLDPSYSNARKIFSALDSLANNKQLKACDIMRSNIICLSSVDTLKEAIKKMKKYEISQMPVFDQKKVVGYISESIILDAMIEHKPSEGNIADIMHDCPPTIAKDATADLISHLLRYYPLVIVMEKDKPIGLITKADMLNHLYK